MRKPSVKRLRQAVRTLGLAVDRPTCPSGCAYCHERVALIAAYFGFNIVEKQVRK